MTLLFYPDASDWVGRVRLGPRGFSFTEAAESGTLAMSSIQVDDPGADLAIVGHHGFKAVETACAWRTLFRGYFADRTVRRMDDGDRTGAARLWDCTVMDANSVLQFEVIRGSTAKRPKETDTQRLAWLLGSGYKGPVSSSDANVLGYGVDMDKADYTGQTMADVLSDCGGASGANYFAAWDDDHDEYRLHYYRPTRSFYSSDLRISNVLSDVDGTTTFAPSIDARLQRDPARVYSGVLYRYGERESYVFRDSATVLAAIGHRREASEQDQAVRTATKATAKADRWLSEAETELDTITVTLHKVPPSRVNLIRAGHRVQVRFSHLPGYSSWTWLRVVRRTVQQDGEDQLHYALTLELADPKQVGSRVRHPARPVEPDVEDGSSVSLARYCLAFAVGRLSLASAMHYESYADETHFYGPDGAIPDSVMQDSHSYNIPWTAGVCALGGGGYGGLSIREQWFKFDPGDLSGVVGLRLSVTLHDTEGDTTDLVVGVSSSAPSGYVQREFDEVTRIPAKDGTWDVFLPSSVLVPSADQYVCFAAAWDCQAAIGTWICTNDEPGISDVVGNGLYQSGQVRIDPKPTATLVTVSGTGLTSWVGGEGQADGSNRTFALVGWNGKGTPQARVGAVVQAYPADYAYDDDAGTVTFRVAPASGSAVAFRYST